MRKIVKLLFLLLFASSVLHAQNTLDQNITICQTSATESFALFASNETFKKEHMNPIPFHYKEQAGKMITFETPDGKKASAYLVKANTDIDNYIFIFHEWWGLNDYIKKEADKYWHGFNKNINILAIDLYDGKLATTREEASKLVSSVTTERAESIIKGAVTFTGISSEIGTLGWCFGGGWALQAAMIAGEQAQGAVMYYGMPEKDENKIAKIEFPVLGIFAEKDGHITPEIVNTFEEDMKSASKSVEIHFYDAVHAFANPSNPDYDKNAADDAYHKSIGFLKRVLD
ncbi:dienelactone hydrolase family protein [Fulvivirga sediminis]|uniref:Dienelactone hydrolase family protein n=1 Tax=Fulvivirga sediminis TaxID=2803949 RepID=A0A937F5I8_9BACT|nr:dienelactone hydrolase family protein [Fulvivirga sediminis]MBL3654705.1 dienelactone hydrolase family protein [Fulvivirga sediminis]